ncbi:MAG: class I SAM-dependent methyltransferase [Candidatus Nanopelagicales bacterium]
MHNPWNEYVLPRMTDQLLDNRTVAGYRERAAAKLTGEVVEIGFGSGLNVPAYPKGVTKVIAIEPSTTARNLARERVGATTIPIEFRGLDGQHLPLCRCICRQRV